MGFLIGFFVILFVGLPLILVIIFISKVNSLTTRVQSLEQELLRLRAATTLAAAPSEPSVAPMSPPIVERKPAPITPTPAPIVSSTPEATVPSHVLVKEKRSQAREEWEAFVGGKLLNRVGALALIIGVGFFLKYAFDNNWITETMRVVLGGITGITLLFLGARFHRKTYHVFAQGLV